MAIKDFYSGQLREIVRFEKNTPAAMGSGFEDSYSELLTTRGRLRKKRGDRGLAFGQITLDSGYELVVRAQDALNTELSATPMASLRIVIDGRLFTIASFEKIEQKGFFYIFLLNESQL